MKFAVSILALAVASAVSAECVMQDKVVTRNQVTVTERADIRRDIVPSVGGGKKCMVTFRAKIGSEWHMATGEAQWDGARPSSEVCAVALQQAERDVKDRVGKKSVVTDSVMICNDAPEQQAIKESHPGTLGKLSQFKPHPSYAGQFYHQGTQCRWFLEPGWVQKQLHQFQGIICQVSDADWVVVDRF